MAYRASADSPPERIDFLSLSLCTSDDASSNIGINDHEQHNHCMQGCYLCAYCLSYRDPVFNFEPYPNSIQAIIWPITNYAITFLDRSQNQARAPPNPIIA